MNDTKIAKIYAKAALKLFDEHSVDVVEQLDKFNELLKSSSELERLLFIEIFTISEKKDVFNELAKRVSLNDVFTNYIVFLIEERRMGLFHMIYKNIILLDDARKGLIRGVIEGSSDSLTDELFKKLRDYTATKLGKVPTLVYVQNEKIAAGNRVTVQDYQVDVTVDNQINNFKHNGITN